MSGHDPIDDNFSEEVASLRIERDEAERSSRDKLHVLSLISHELRTSLSGVIGMTDLLQQTPLNHEQADLLDSLRQSSSSIQELLTAILDYARIESGQLKLESSPVSWRALLAACTEQLRPVALASGLSFHLEIDPDMPVWIKGDPERLKQIVTTLTREVLSSLRQGGVRIVVTPSVGESLVVMIRSAEVADTIAPLTSHATVLGGNTIPGELGVMLCDGLIRALGGDLLVACEAGQWQAFRCRLPMQVCEAPYSEASRIDTATLPRLRVLIAEDIPVNQMLASHLLARIGMQGIEVAANGMEALEAVKRTRFDVVLMDVGMPVMDGIEATQAIRALGDQCYQPHIVAVTADAYDENRSACLAAGMNDFISKPYRRDDLIMCLSRVVI